MVYWIIIALWTGWLLDKWLGDPSRLPHPIVGFGKCISFLEKKLNRGKHRQLKGALLVILCIAGTFVLTYTLLLLGAVLGLQVEFLAKEYDLLPKSFFGLGLGVYLIVSAVLVFYGLAGTTLIREVRQVFQATDRSVEEGRRQVGRIVGRNTEQLTPNQVRTAALETLSENLNDGVIAPLFWFLIGGLPAMMCYKMINTMDSMIGYKNERYKSFGYWAAKIDDIANYLPARFTAILIILSSHFPHAGTKTSQNIKEQFRFLFTYGPCHASPNSGWPEAALASVLDCRFGGSHFYFNKPVHKPYIGKHTKILGTEDMKCAVALNRYADFFMILLCTLLLILLRNILPFC